MKRLVRANTEYEAGGETFDGYMGAVGWKGKNADAHLSVAEIAKIIKSQFRKKFPGYKISARSERASRIDILITVPRSNLMSKDEFIKEAVYNPYKMCKNGYHRIGCYDANGQWEEHQSDDFSHMSDEERADFFSRYYDYTLDKYTNQEYSKLNYGVEPIPLIDNSPLKYVHDLMDSFNYDDSNAMVDYFDTNFYGFLYYKYGA